jgi:hypothetical protein
MIQYQDMVNRTTKLPKLAAAVIQAALLAPGDPACKHIEESRRRPEYGDHLVGICRLCGRVKDYSILHAEVPALGRKFDQKLPHSMTFENFAHSQRGGKAPRRAKSGRQLGVQNV